MLFIAVQFILFYLMLLIGLNLTFSDLLKVKKQPLLIFGITLSQLIILPFLAYLLVLLFKPEEHIAVGLMLVSICPSGALSNFYTLLAKADTALSLTLTAVGSLLSIFILPIILIVFYSHFITSESALSGIATTQAVLLGGTLLAPVLLGVCLRWKFEVKIVKLLPLLERCGFIGLLFLIAAILFKNAGGIGEQLQSLVTISSIFTLLAMASAACISWLTSQKSNSAMTIIFEFPVRNLAIVSIIALNVFNRPDYLLFAALFVVIQTPFMLFLILYSRKNITYT